MSYVLHAYRMTYKTYDIQEYIFVHPEEWYSMPQFFGIYLFHPLDIAKNESFHGGFAPPATWANHRSVFNGIRFYSFQNIVSTKTQQGMFRVTRNLLGYSQKNLPIGGYISKAEYLNQPIGSEEMRKFYCSDCTSFQSKASLL